MEHFRVPHLDPEVLRVLLVMIVQARRTPLNVLNQYPVPNSASRVCILLPDNGVCLIDSVLSLSYT